MEEREVTAKLRRRWWGDFAIGVTVGIYLLVVVGTLWILYLDHFYVLRGFSGGVSSSVSGGPGP